MKYKKLLFSIIAVILFIMIIFIGYAIICRYNNTNKFKDEVSEYLNKRYSEEMCIYEIGIDHGLGFTARAYPIENSLIKFQINQINGQMVDEFLIKCLENEISQKVKNEILNNYDEYECIIVLRKGTFLEEDLYLLYNKHNRPAKLDELSKFPEIEHLLLVFENVNETSVEKEIPNILETLSKYFTTQEIRIGIKINNEWINECIKPEIN